MGQTVRVSIYISIILYSIPICRLLPLTILCSFLVDAPVLAICNRWRRERGEKEIALHELSNAQDLPAAP